MTPSAPPRPPSCAHPILYPYCGCLPVAPQPQPEPEVQTAPEALAILVPTYPAPEVPTPEPGALGPITAAAARADRQARDDEALGLQRVRADGTPWSWSEEAPVPRPDLEALRAQVTDESWRTPYGRFAAASLVRRDAATTYGDTAPEITGPLLEAERAALQEYVDAVPEGGVDPLLGLGPDQLGELLRQADAEECRRDFGTFYRMFWPEISPTRPDYSENPGTDALIAHAQAVGDGVINHLGVACSPGLGKTSALSVGFPAWMWARDPSWRVICASHAHNLAHKIALDFYRVVTSDKYRRLFPEVELASHAVSALATTRGGIRYAVGVESGLTGLRANAGIVDDSLAAQDADNADAIANVNDWFGATWSTRFDDAPGRPAQLIAIQQRLGEGDLINHVRKLGAVILELAAEYDPDRHCSTPVWSDPRTRRGELLAPTIHSAERLAALRTSLGERKYQGQYNQNPSTREGKQFKVGMWGWCTLEARPTEHVRPRGARPGPSHPIGRRADGSLDLDWLCVSVDPTGGSVSEDASALGLAIVGGKGTRAFVLEDLTEGPRGFDDQVSDMKVAIARAAAIAGRQRRFTCLVEKKALGTGSAPQMEKAIAEGRILYPDGSPVVCEVAYYEPTGKGPKELRADHMEPDVRAGLVMLVDGAAWVTPFVGEFGVFPSSGARDDRVDVVQQAIAHHRQQAGEPDWGAALKNMGGLAAALGGGRRWR